MSSETAKLRKIVHQTIEELSDTVNSDKLLELLPNLHASGWDELIEERFVSKLCGYPTCSRESRPSLGRQMFQIDRKSGKIYENCKERYKFCSDNCFEKSISIRKQLNDEALWITGKISSRMEKKFELPQDIVKLIEEITNEEKTPKKVKPVDKEIHLVEDSILAQMTDLRIRDEESDKENSGDDDDDEFKHIEPYKKCADDEEFLESVHRFVATKPSTSKVETPKKIEKTLEKKEELQKKEEEILAKLRAKYGKGTQTTRKPITIIEPLPMKPKRINNVDDIQVKTEIKVKKDENSRNSWLHELLRSWISEETRKMIHEGYRPVGGEVEKLLMDFLAGKSTDENKVELPNLDKFNIKEKRLNILLQSLKLPWIALEESLQLCTSRRDLLPRLCATFNLTAENIAGWNKREIQCITYALFVIICRVDSELEDEFFQKGRISDKLVESAKDKCQLETTDLIEIYGIFRESNC
ncbi:unnamed protein product [Caenorhabditis bovis]|uniref:RNA polymerase II subunit B1 CTD phosphatase RPAP2 homolog n=1 Tax=Caenorhabditis bovis TaxID=2654633 RepID=A0A8S1ES15_9PELO|nr:unnamed protein product [Caenorhabditis bovis]